MVNIEVVEGIQFYNFATGNFLQIGLMRSRSWLARGSTVPICCLCCISFLVASVGCPILHDNGWLGAQGGCCCLIFIGWTHGCSQGLLLPHLHWLIWDQLPRFSLLVASVGCPILLDNGLIGYCCFHSTHLCWIWVLWFLLLIFCFAIMGWTFSCILCNPFLFWYTILKFYFIN